MSQASIPEVVAATLKEMGRGAPASTLLRTILIRDGYFVGHKYRFDGGYAAWVAKTDVIEIYDDDGKLLKTVARGESEGGEAA